MKILILTYGTRGDVQPFIALGRALADRGDEVVLSTSTRFEAFVREHGLTFNGVPDDLLAVLDTHEGKNMMENTKNILDAIRHNLKFARRIGPMLREQIDSNMRVAQEMQPDVIVFHPKGMGGPVIAEAVGAQPILALPFPMLVATGDEPHLGFPRLPFGAGYNRLTYGVVNTMTAMAQRGPYKHLRNAQNLPKAKHHTAIHKADGSRIPALLAVSPSVVARPTDWGITERVSGYWFLDQPSDWSPPDDLRAFLEAGPPPIYIGFGSISGKNPERLGDIAVKALEKTGQRGLLATGWGGLSADNLSDTIFKLDQAPHDWLFPRMAAVVHHGGAGTTAAGLRAGIPSIITPFMGDQPYWAKRVEDLGVGPKSWPQKKLTADRLAHAIEVSVSDVALRERARKLGERIRAEDGLANALDFIDVQIKN